MQYLFAVRTYLPSLLYPYRPTVPAFYFVYTARSPSFPLGLAVFGSIAADLSALGVPPGCMYKIRLQTK